MKERKINILGTQWTIRYATGETEEELEGDRAGFTYYFKPLILIDKDRDKEIIRHSLRHEIIHAFKNESGLKSCEIMDGEQDIDWTASQLTKIYKVYEKLGIE